MESVTDEMIQKALNDAAMQIDVNKQIRDESELIPRCLNTWGIMPQLDIVVEEMAELTQAIMKFRRYVYDQDRHELLTLGIVSEMIDVSLMLKQLEYIMYVITSNQSAIQFQPGINIESLMVNMRNEKYERLRERLDKADEVKKHG
jgi:hypothetical protein